MIVSNESYEDERLRWRKSEEWCAVRDVMQQEYQSLKDETKELRQCQTTFFWSSITATGAVLAFATNSVIANKNLTESYSILLQLFTLIAPLFIVNPVWCIFMDKASSVTRITGYLRVLEDMIIKREKSGLFYTSWENAIKI